MEETQQPTTAPVVDVVPPGRSPGGTSPTGAAPTGETPAVSPSPGPSTSASPSPSPARKSPPRQNMHQLYKQPAPLKIFPFPSLTSNPLSLLHLAFTWVSQIWSPPPAEPSVIHTAYWDHDTRTITVTDEKSMMELWQQGFFGKGSLSRSEPNWLKREKTRLGLIRDKVSEVETNKRRAERNRVKWDRARAEQEALEQRRLDEAAHEEARLEQVVVLPEALPEAVIPNEARVTIAAPVGPLELLCLPNSLSDLESLTSRLAPPCEEIIDSTEISKYGSSSSGNDDVDSSTTFSEHTPLKQTKSVRFSPTVESTEFLHNDPPSPPRSVSSSTLKPHEVNGNAPVSKGEPSTSVTSETTQHSTDTETEPVVVNKEHLQLLPEEALFLTFAFGALEVVDSTSLELFSTKDLLRLLRQNSYFPPRLSQDLAPDDPFLIHYAVYHHFRSLGWVPRGGIKFGVDWLLYTRGPVFDHAEYGVHVLPSYSDPYWKSVGKEAPRKSWHWLMGVNRVLSKVFKSVLLVYVEIPPPSAFLEEDGSPRDGLVGVLKQYRIREQLVKRWSSNRNRD
ncbi:tRNA splicing endonuclease subunit sen2 [Diaporthe australafricana]|uniref:tRNA-intron lyase n=1 Tax=Diaporthe australafricana TaxID=127596 RepID=A0ABR3X5P2_9PEZI